MFAKSIARRTGGSRIRRLVAEYGSACVMLVLLTGCGPGSMLGFLTGYIPTEEELAEYTARIESLPLLQVRIVNNTDVLTSVALTSGVSGLEQDLFTVVGESYLTSVDDRTVLITAGGTATGSIKCGEVIGLSIRAPYNGPTFGYAGGRLGIYQESGNIQLSGVGVSDERFSGDLVSTTRFLRPEEDEIDCESAVLVIEIDTAAVYEIVDPDTGAVTAPAVWGIGTITLE